MLTAKLGKTKNSSRYFEFLIDSGSDYTIIPQSDAAILGIDYEKLRSKEIIVEAANLSKIHGKETKMNIAIREYSFVIPVLITKEEVDRLIGRKGVFTHFDITFRENAGIVVLKNIFE